jgi:hypothetical protein
MARLSSNDDLFTMNQIPNIANRNVSPNVSPNRNLNYPDPERQFFGLNYGRKLYELDYLLKKNIRMLTGASKRVYKGLHLVCDDERKTCKYKILDSEIEARGDCFFHSALYNLGKKYLGPRGSRLEEIDNIENAAKFREFLVDYYVEKTGNMSALEFREQYHNADSQMVQAYAHKFNRNVCVFIIRDEAAFDRGESQYDLSVELMINKNALRGKFDFFILTQAPEHYTTLKRIPGFKPTTIMNRFLDYVYTVEASNINEWKSELPIREDIRIQHDSTEAKGSFEDIIRPYMITGVRNVYRLFQTPFPEFPPVEDLPNVENVGSRSLSPTTLAGLSEEEQLEYVLKKTAKGSRGKSPRGSKAKLSNANAPFGQVLGVTRYTNPKMLKPIGPPPLGPPPLAPLRPLSDFESSEDHAKKMFAQARDMSPYTAAQLKNHFDYSPGSKGSLKPKSKVKARTSRLASRSKKSNESISNANIAQLLEVHSPKTVEQITGKKLNGLNEKSKKPKKSSESISNVNIAEKDRQFAEQLQRNEKEQMNRDMSLARRIENALSNISNKQVYNEKGSNFVPKNASANILAEIEESERKERRKEKEQINKNASLARKLNTSSKSKLKSRVNAKNKSAKPNSNKNKFIPKSASNSIMAEIHKATEKEKKEKENRERGNIQMAKEMERDEIAEREQMNRNASFARRLQNNRSRSPNARRPAPTPNPRTSNTRRFRLSSIFNKHIPRAFSRIFRG